MELGGERFIGPCHLMPGKNKGSGMESGSLRLQCVHKDCVEKPPSAPHRPPVLGAGQVLVPTVMGHGVRALRGAALGWTDETSPKGSAANGALCRGPGGSFLKLSPSRAATGCPVSGLTLPKEVNLEVTTHFCLNQHQA
jgi:hypothetical protein